MTFKLNIKPQLQEDHGQTKRPKTRIALLLLRYNAALQLAVTTILINFTLAVFTFLNGFNSIYCAFGVDCIIGVLTASILVWRFASFKCEKLNMEEEDGVVEEKKLFSSEHAFLLGSYVEGRGFSNYRLAMNAYELFDRSAVVDNVDDHRREMWSTLALGIVMIFSGFSVIVRSIIELIPHFSLQENFETDKIDPIFLLAAVSFILNVLLVMFKMVVYYYVGSNSMLIEGLTSLISALFAATLMISSHYSDTIQHLDQIVSLAFGVFLIVYGVYSVMTTFSHTIIEWIKNRSHHSHPHRQNYVTLL